MLLAASAVRAPDWIGRATDEPAPVAVYKVMPLFWIVHDIDGERRVFIQEAGSLVFARLHAGIAGLRGQFVEAHALVKEYRSPARPLTYLPGVGQTDLDVLGLSGPAPS